MPIAYGAKPELYFSKHGKQTRRKSPGSSPSWANKECRPRGESDQARGLCDGMWRRSAHTTQKRTRPCSHAGTRSQSPRHLAWTCCRMGCPHECNSKSKVVSTHTHKWLASEPARQQWTLQLTRIVQNQQRYVQNCRAIGSQQMS